MNVSSDRRRLPERSPFVMLVGWGDEPTPLTHSRDLSCTGIFLKTDVRPDLGSAEQISFSWGDETLTCEGRVVRHGHDGVALEFVSPDEPFLLRVQEMMLIAQL